MTTKVQSCTHYLSNGTQIRIYSTSKHDKRPHLHTQHKKSTHHKVQKTKTPWGKTATLFHYDPEIQTSSTPQVIAMMIMMWIKQI